MTGFPSQEKNLITDRARNLRKTATKIFQIEIPLSKTEGKSTGFGYIAESKTSEMRDMSGVIHAIENEGWRLEHANFVYRMTGIESSKKMMTAARSEVLNGEIIGIYIFRAILIEKGFPFS